MKKVFALAVAATMGLSACAFAAEPASAAGTQATQSTVQHKEIKKHHKKTVEQKAQAAKKHQKKTTHKKPAQQTPAA